MCLAQEKRADPAHERVFSRPNKNKQKYLL